MKIIYDTETHSFSISIDADSAKFASKSQEITHNLIRTILRPNHDSVNHWIIDEVFAMISNLMSSYKHKNRRVEYIFDVIADDCDDPKRFYFDGQALQNYIELVEDEPYGEFRKLSKQQVALGLILLLKELKVKVQYSPRELKSILYNWIESIKDDYWLTHRDQFKDVRIQELKTDIFTKIRQFYQML